jgi:hypothetical protein
MKAAGPFAQVPLTPEPIIAQVRRQLERDGLAKPGGALDHVAERAVRELWGSRVKTFVPVLALRQAREVLLTQGATLPSRPAITADTLVTMAPAPRRGHDALSLNGDGLYVDDGDALSL